MGGQDLGEVALPHRGRKHARRGRYTRSKVQLISARVCVRVLWANCTRGKFADVDDFVTCESTNFQQGSIDLNKLVPSG